MDSGAVDVGVVAVAAERSVAVGEDDPAGITVSMTVDDSSSVTASVEGELDPHAAIASTAASPIPAAPRRFAFRPFKITVPSLPLLISRINRTVVTT
jgi:hypothetical protein